MPIIEVRNLTKKFGDRVAVEDLSLRFLSVIKNLICAWTTVLCCLIHFVSHMLAISSSKPETPPSVTE